MKLNKIFSLMLAASMSVASLSVPVVYASETEDGEDARLIYEDNFDNYTGFSASATNFAVRANIFSEDSKFTTESRYSKFALLADENNVGNKSVQLDSSYATIGSTSNYLPTNMEYLSDEALLTKENQMEKGSMKLSFSFRLDDMKEPYKTSACFRVMSAEEVYSNSGAMINDKFTMFNVNLQYQSGVLKGAVQTGKNGTNNIYNTNSANLVVQNQWYDVELIYDLIGNNLHTKVINQSTGKALLDSFDHDLNWYLPFNDREEKEYNSIHTVMFKPADGAIVSVDNFKLEYYLDKPEISPKDIVVTDYKGVAQENLDAVSPAIGAIRIPFGTTMTEESTNEYTVTLKDSHGNEVPYEADYEHDAYIMDFSNSEWLNNDETYTLFIPETAQNIFGESFGRDFTYKFTTKMPEFMAIESVKIGKEKIAELADITNGATIDVNVEYSNTTEEEVDNTVIISYYDDDMLVYTQSVKGEGVPVGDVGVKKVSFTAPSAGVLELANVDRVSVCLWESFANSSAYVDSIEISDNEEETVVITKTEPTVTYSYNKSTMNIQGIADEDSKYVTVQILKPGNSFEAGNAASDAEADAMVFYRGQADVKNGAYSVDIRFDEKQNMDSTLESGVYPARIFVGNTKLDIDEVYINAYPDYIADYDALADAVDSNDFEEFKRIINENRQSLNYEVAFAADDVLGEELQGYFEYVKDNSIDADDEVTNSQIFKTYLAMEYIANDELDDVQNYIYDLFVDDEVKALCAEMVYDEIGSYFSGLMSEDIDNLDEFEEEVEKALILTTTKYGNGYGTLKSVLEVCGDVVDISNPVVAACKSLMGKTFNDADEFKTAYRKAVAGLSGGGGGSTSGGGNSSPSGSSGGSNRISSMKVESTEKPKPVPVTKEFDDIDNYEWATESILSLADLGIINGISENKFAPSRNVQRAEFAKIIVGALDAAEYEYGENIFADAANDAWFTPYINIAADLGIAKGIGYGCFGVSENIKRQDMAVMIYNALVYRGVEMTSGELHFDDSDEIADYAKNAVSALYNMGAINGVSETTFEPNSLATRAAAAKMVYGVLSKLQG